MAKIGTRTNLASHACFGVPFFELSPALRSRESKSAKFGTFHSPENQSGRCTIQLTNTTVRRRSVDFESIECGGRARVSRTRNVGGSRRSAFDDGSRACARVAEADRASHPRAVDGRMARHAQRGRPTL